MPQAFQNNAKENSIADFFKAKRVLILGFGREGRSSYAFLRKFFPGIALGIADANEIIPPDSTCRVHCGKDYLEAMAEYDLVLKSPGISFANVKFPQNVNISCQTDIFLRFAPCRTVGVTGTKGKTTTSSLIYEMLSASGISAILAGNMGIPVLDSWEMAQSKDMVFVLELSSHQLEFTSKSPQIAVWTNLYPEHLDHYSTGFSGYLNAKLNILRYQKPDDYYVFCSAQKLDNYLGSLCLQGFPCPVNVPESLPYPLSDRLKGTHNLADLALASRTALLLGADDDSIAKAALEFKGIPHRMEPLGSFAGITFVDDCIATVPAATLAALDALPECKTLIFGGQDRHIDYSSFCLALSQSRLDTLIALPDTGHSIAPQLEKLCSGKKLIIARDMENAVQAAFDNTRPGESCLLSPAAPSYNIYRDFEEKASHFYKLIQAYSL